MSSERGVTIAELLITLFAGLIVMTGILTMVESVTRSSVRVSSRVAADQLARPVMQRILDELHSTCVAPASPPVEAGSTGSSISFLSKTGSAPSVTPDRHVISLSGTTMTDLTYPATGGSAPNWTFAGAPSQTRELLTTVGPASLGNPAANVPLFQYYSYTGSQVSTTPLPTPLSATDAAKTIKVTVSFETSPTSNGARDANAAVTLSNSVTLRLTPASGDVAVTNGPCA